MELTKQQAVDISVAAGDESMRRSGREVWSAEDAAVATEVFNRLCPVQKMDVTFVGGNDDAH